MKRPELARAEAQGEHKKEQAECHKSSVGTGGSQPHRKHPRSVQGGGFGFLRRDFGLWVGAAVLRIHESGDSSPKELSLAAESLEGSTRTWGSGPSGSELGDTELHRDSPVTLLVECQYPESSCSEPWRGYCRRQSSLDTTCEEDV